MLSSVLRETPVQRSKPEYQQVFLAVKFVRPGWDKIIKKTKVPHQPLQSVRTDCANYTETLALGSLLHPGSVGSSSAAHFFFLQKISIVSKLCVSWEYIIGRQVDKFWHSWEVMQLQTLSWKQVWSRCYTSEKHNIWRSTLSGSKQFVVDVLKIYNALQWMKTQNAHCIRREYTVVGISNIRDRSKFRHQKRANNKCCNLFIQFGFIQMLAMRAGQHGKTE